MADNHQLVLLQQRLDDHIEDFKQHCEDEDKRWNRLISVQEHNSKCLQDLTQSNIELTNSTKDIVEVWNAATGTVKVLSAVGRAVKWLSGFAFIGVIFAWLAERFYN